MKQRPLDKQVRYCARLVKRLRRKQRLPHHAEAAGTSTAKARSQA